MERFIAFRTDREFKLTFNDAQLEWGKPIISGAVFYRLGNVPADQVVFLEVQGGEDQLMIEPIDLIDLTAPGIERFSTAPRPVLTYESSSTRGRRSSMTRQCHFNRSLILHFLVPKTQMQRSR